ncbi:MAG: 30S ribosomal protein S6 [Syntrophales bacterium]|nr:30S ribosomal protein S6 [Syntrophales bacterium]
MRRYETIFIAHPDLPDDTISEVVERLSKIITDLKGIVVKVERWGKRKLAYPIKKQQKGYYILMDFVGERTVVTELEKNMKFDDNVLKYLSVKKTEEVDLEEIEKEVAGSSKDEETEEIASINMVKDIDDGKPPEESPEEKEHSE